MRKIKNKDLSSTKINTSNLKRNINRITSLASITGLVIVAVYVFKIEKFVRNTVVAFAEISLITMNNL